jgi:hypothetical protein
MAPKKLKHDFRDISSHWIDNCLTVSGSGYTKFWKAAKGPNGLMDFDKLLVSSVGTSISPSLGDLRQYREDLWGTNCQPRQIIRQDPHCLTFQTSWNPPLRLFHQMSKKFPGLVFQLEAFDRLFKKAWQYCWHRGLRLEGNEGGSEDFRFPWALEVPLEIDP